MDLLTNTNFDSRISKPSIIFMKNNYLLAALTTLIVISCKKETIKTTDDQPTVSTDDYTVCYGSNTWENDVTYVGDVPVLQVVYNNKVYFFHNNGNVPPTDPFRKKITIYDGTSWQIISSEIPFDPLYVGFAFVIGTKAYFGYTTFVGSTSHGNSYQYNFTNNTWSNVEDFPDYYLDYAAYFTVGNKGYVVGGIKNSTATNSNKTWEFDPTASPKWRARANIPVTGRQQARGFSIGNKGYIVNGKTARNPEDDTYYKTLLEYNPSTNTWATKASFPGVARSNSKCFVIEGCAYVGEGQNNETGFIDFYKYDPADNAWLRIPDYSSYGEMIQAFSLNSKGYALWRPHYPLPYRFKKYNPVICSTIPSPGGVVNP
jgi:hypothetical protein